MQMRLHPQSLPRSSDMFNKANEQLHTKSFIVRCLDNIMERSTRSTQFSIVSNPLQSNMSTRNAWEDGRCVL